MIKVGSDEKKAAKPQGQGNQRERYDPKEWRFKERRIRTKPYVDDIRPVSAPPTLPGTRTR